MATGQTVGVRQVAEGVEMPTAFESPPEGPGIAYVVDQADGVYLLMEGGLRDQPVLDLADRLVERTNPEQGVLGLALHPEFHRNGRFFVRYSAPPGADTPDGYTHRFRLSEFRANPDRLRADVESERVVLDIPQPYATHNAGAIEFGPDGYLYVAVGDGGWSFEDESGFDTGRGHARDWYAANRGGNGQDVTDNLMGSVLRIDVNTDGNGRGYGIPNDNPLVGRAGRDEHYAWGFRNPWRMSFSGSQLYVADVGRNKFEEINRVSRGGNYGWNVREGAACVDNRDSRPRLSQAGRIFSWGYLENLFASITSTCPATTPDGERLHDPVVVYPQMRDGEAIGNAVIGGYVYENETIPSLQGKYVFGDFRAEESGRLFATAPPGRTTVPEYTNGTDSTDETNSSEAVTATGSGDFWPIAELTVSGQASGRLGRIVYSFGQDREGELYVLTPGAIFKLVPP